MPSRRRSIKAEVSRWTEMDFLVRTANCIMFRSKGLFRDFEYSQVPLATTSLFIHTKTLSVISYFLACVY